tara:strand:- start:1474 stop:1641 length:168 start_codon:yes stop_codon:yes gene_type:complete
MKKKDVKRAEAIERNEQWSNLLPEEQLARLDRLKLRATKQRTKILDKIDKDKKKK